MLSCAGHVPRVAPTLCGDLLGPGDHFPCPYLQNVPANRCACAVSLGTYAYEIDGGRKSKQRVRPLRRLARHTAQRLLSPRRPTST